MLSMQDAVTCLHDQDIEPCAQIGGNHVHESESGHELVLVDVHLLVEENEVHLHKDKCHLHQWTDHGEQVVAVGRFLHVELEKHANLDARVDHATNPKH